MRYRERRYSITRNDADLITTALTVIMRELNAHKDELTIRELNQLSATETLYRKLTSYQWEVVR